MASLRDLDRTSPAQSHVCSCKTAAEADFQIISEVTCSCSLTGLVHLPKSNGPQCMDRNRQPHSPYLFMDGYIFKFNYMYIYLIMNFINVANIAVIPPYQVFILDH